MHNSDLTPEGVENRNSLLVNTHLNHRRIFLFSTPSGVGRYCACEILITNPIDWLYAFPVLVKGLYQTESYSLHVMQLIRI
jgi:hypothetical protein